MTDIEIERLEDAARRVLGGETPQDEETGLDGHAWFGWALTDFWPARPQASQPAAASADI